MTTQVTNFNGELPGYGYPTLSDDPFITTAELAMSGRAPIPAPLTGPALTGPHPHVIAYSGYIPAPGWPRAYCRNASGDWIDTETGAPWLNPMQQRFAANWADLADLRTKERSTP